MKQYLFFFVFSTILIIFSSSSVFSVEKKDNSLSVYLEQALAGNDTLQTARAKFRAATKKIPQAGILPDPQFAVQYYLQPVETRTGPQQASIGINQAVPWFSKLSLMRNIAEHEVAIAGSEVAVAELEVARQVKQAYIEYSFLGKSQQIIADTLELLRYLEGVARDRYIGGKTTYFDVLKIQVELSKIQDKARRLEDQTRPLRIRINNLLGVAPELARPVPAHLPETVLQEKEDRVSALALENAPVLRAAQERITQARTRTELAKKDFYPDFSFSLKTILTGGAEYGNPPDSGDDPIIAGVTMNLPIFRERRHAKVAEQKAQVSVAQSLRQNEQRRIDNNIEQGLYAYQDAERRLVLYRDELLPKTRQQLEVAVSGFQSGKNSILEIIDAERSLLTFDLAESRALADRALAVAELEALAGVVLGDWRVDDEISKGSARRAPTE
jgi:outer membrane protein TolC